MGLRLGLGELAEHGESYLLSMVAELRRVDNGCDFGERAVGVVRMFAGLRVVMRVAVVMRMVMPMPALARAVKPRHVVVVVLVRIVEADVEVAGRKAALLDAAHDDLEAVNGERGQRLAQAFLACAEVEKGGDRHVAADARAAVEDECPSHALSFPSNG